MIYTQSTETWVSCDNDGFTMFAGFAASKADVIDSMGKWGWTFKGKARCPFCSEAAGMITPQQNMFNKEGV